MTAAVDQAVAAVRSGEDEEIDRILVRLLRSWFDTRPSEVADDDVEALAWELARTALTVPAATPTRAGARSELVIARTYVACAKADRRREAQNLWAKLALTPRLDNRQRTAMASIRIVQVIAALARCHVVEPGTPAGTDHPSPRP